MTKFRPLRFVRPAGSLAVIAFAIATLAAPARTGQLADGTTFFESALDLESAVSFEDRTSVPGGRITFTVAVPEDAREPLSQLEFEQINGFDRGWRFDLDSTRAERRALSSDSDATDAGKDVDTDVEVTIVAEDARNLDRLAVQFVEPIAPGERVTLRLRLHYTPRASGVYQWRVRAAPTGDRAQAQTLGVARFHFTNRP
ncbi:MAG: DUF2808 domain-containing protein [Geitlerinemataceae cyanobacterium]